MFDKDSEDFTIAIGIAGQEEANTGISPLRNGHDLLFSQTYLK
jgi:hypothetical protein